MSVSARRITAVLFLIGLLGGCVAPEGGFVADADACRAQRLALNNTASFFAEDIAPGEGEAPQNPGGAAATGTAGGYLQALRQENPNRTSLRASLAADLERENLELDRAQLAFDLLMDCRVRQALAIRAVVANGSLDATGGDAQMVRLRDRTQREVAMAQSVRENVSKRGAEFDAAVEGVAPGATKAALAARNVPFREVRVNRATPLRLRPDVASPEIGGVEARQAVRARASSNGFALVETAAGQQGYVAIDAFPSRRALGTPRVTPAGVSGDVRSLAASYIARRDNFVESVAQARAVVEAGLEMAAGQGLS